MFILKGFGSVTKTENLNLHDLRKKLRYNLQSYNSTKSDKYFEGEKFKNGGAKIWGRGKKLANSMVGSKEKERKNSVQNLAVSDVPDLYRKNRKEEFCQLIEKNSEKIAKEFQSSIKESRLVPEKSKVRKREEDDKKKGTAIGTFDTFDTEEFFEKEKFLKENLQTQTQEELRKKTKSPKKVSFREDFTSFKEDGKEKRNNLDFEVENLAYEVAQAELELENVKLSLKEIKNSSKRENKIFNMKMESKNEEIECIEKNFLKRAKLVGQRRVVRTKWYNEILNKMRLKNLEEE